MILRIRSRDGTDRISVPDSASATVADLQRLIESHLTVPVPLQRISLDPALLLPNPSAAVPLLADPAAPLASLRLANGAFIYLAYPPDARSARPTPPKVLSAAGSFGKKMTMDDLIARQIRVTRQENALCAAASFDRDAANAFQLYVAEYLAFAVKRAGFLYGRIDAETKEVLVDFIYEPPQQGFEDVVHLMRDPDEEARVDTIAEGLGMRRVGLVFTQAVGRRASKTGEYTMSNREVVQAAQLQAEGGTPEWVTAIVKLEVGDDGTGDVHFEAFQMSEICVKLFKDGVLETEVQDADDPRLSKMRKEVVAGGKDTMKVDNDFFLVPVKISDHQGPLSVGFPIENRGSPVGMSALRSHLERMKHLTFVRRISDFHLLLKLATFLDAKSDMPTIAACVKTQSRMPEGYQFLIESFASQG
ncbi:NPL4-like protein [Zea mays]|uniref:NPL4-like protein 1 n=2 Tax=Zea mays TaxID=4577 RepID=A0A1D6N681_MAIZE|nr:NPL4-like protein 1 [Zea mays]PWZ32814.1 NPL4-like protein [Zea mays]